MQTEITRDQMLAGIQMVKAVADVIQELGEVQNGILYSALMTRLDLNGYNRILGMLERTKLIVVTPTMIKWIGPKFEKNPTSNLPTVGNQVGC